MTRIQSQIENSLQESLDSEQFGFGVTKKYDRFEIYFLKINYLSIFGLCPEIKNVFLDLELISGQHKADQNLPTLFWMVQKIFGSILLVVDLYLYHPSCKEKTLLI